MFEVGKIYKPASGRHYKCICVDGNDVWLKDLSTGLNGTYVMNEFSTFTEVIPKTKVQGWMNVFRSGDGCLIPGERFYRAKSNALRLQNSPDYIGTFYIDQEFDAK